MNITIKNVLVEQTTIVLENSMEKEQFKQLVGYALEGLRLSDDSEMNKNAVAQLAWYISNTL